MVTLFTRAYRRGVRGSGSSALLVKQRRADDETSPEGSKGCPYYVVLPVYWARVTRGGPTRVPVELRPLAKHGSSGREQDDERNHVGHIVGARRDPLTATFRFV